MLRHAGAGRKQAVEKRVVLLRSRPGVARLHRPVAMLSHKIDTMGPVQHFNALAERPGMQIGDDLFPRQIRRGIRIGSNCIPSRKTPLD